MNEQALEVRGETSLARMSMDDLVLQVKDIQEAMKKVMHDKEHYGKIPGCGDKPTLLKPGAEKLLLFFRMAPRYTIIKSDLGRGHREYEITCDLVQKGNESFCGSGVGSSSTMEGKYRYRNAEKKCPECGKNSIIKGKKEYGGGWLCWAKKEGCGMKWDDGDAVIEDQADGKVEHDNPADYYNTVLKMGKKRALVDAVLTATAASDIFTQDIEDLKGNIDAEVIDAEVVEEPEKKTEAATTKKTTAKKAPTKKSFKLF